MISEDLMKDSDPLSKSDTFCNRKSRSKEALGILGGTFDPIHRGHLHLANQALRLGELDRVCFIPNAIPVHRPPPKASCIDRLAMLRLALAAHPLFFISEVELLRNEPSYMVDTLTQMKAQHPESRFHLILGADSFNHFDTWHRWKDILSLSTLLVLQRPEHLIQLPQALAQIGYQLMDKTLTHTSPSKTIYFIKTPMLNISSTEIRAQFKRKQIPSANEIPKVVLQYIQQHRIY